MTRRSSDPLFKTTMVVVSHKIPPPPMVPKRPAYEGAKFDVEGYCLVHRCVRLCSVADDGRYKAVRKICPKCGTSTLMKSAGRKGHIHGYSPKKDENPPQLNVLSGLLIKLNPKTAKYCGSTLPTSSSDYSMSLSEEEYEERQIELFRRQPGLRASTLRKARRKCIQE